MLHSTDPEMFDLCQRECERQRNCIELVASENIFSESVIEAVSSSYYNRYSEDHVGLSSNSSEILENICQRRALEAFQLSPEDWGVDVRPYGGSVANFEVYTSLVGYGGKILGLAFVDGGHTTHGHVSHTGEKISASSIYFDSLAYFTHHRNHTIDYEELEKKAVSFHPKLIIAGASAHPRKLDYGQFRKIATKVGAILMADMAHISGLIATGMHPSPFEYADVVTTTTHKTLRSGRGALIFYRKRRLVDGVEVATDYEKKIRKAVYPAVQGGAQYCNIAGIAVGLRECTTPAFKKYIQQVVSNAKHLAKCLKDEYAYTIITGGTDTHLFLIDLRMLGLDGERVYPLLVDVGINLDAWTMPGQSYKNLAGGIRIGTPAVTTRGFGLKEMDQIAAFLHAGLTLALEVAQSAASVSMKDFEIALSKNQSVQTKIAHLRAQVAAFASSFPISLRMDN